LPIAGGEAVNESMSAKGRIVIISGPSGVGKSSICRELVKRFENVCLSVSLTTRPIGKVEADGKDYWFVSEQEFKQRVRKGRLLEYAEVFGHLYGTPKDKVDEALKGGKTVLLEIDVQGARKVKSKYPDAVMVFIFPPSQRDLVQRMSGRGRGEGGEAAERRLSGAPSEMAAAWQYFEHMVINDQLEQAVNEVAEVIRETQLQQEKV